MCNSILGNLESGGKQSRIKCTPSFGQRSGRSRNIVMVVSISTGFPSGDFKCLVNFIEEGGIITEMLYCYIFLICYAFKALFMYNCSFTHFNLFLA